MKNALSERFSPQFFFLCEFLISIFFPNHYEAGAGYGLLRLVLGCITALQTRQEVQKYRTLDNEKILISILVFFSPIFQVILSKKRLLQSINERRVRGDINIYFIYLFIFYFQPDLLNYTVKENQATTVGTVYRPSADERESINKIHFGVPDDY